MTDFQKYDASTHPEVKLIDDYNSIVDHGLENPYAFIIRKNGSNFEAVYGGGSDQAGKLLANSQSTNPVTTLTQAITNANGAVIFVRKDCGELDLDSLQITTETYLKSDGAILDLTVCQSVDTKWSIEITEACAKCTFKGFTIKTTVDGYKHILANADEVIFKEIDWDCQIDCTDRSAANDSAHSVVHSKRTSGFNQIKYLGGTLKGGKATATAFTLAFHGGIKRLEVRDFIIEYSKSLNTGLSSSENWLWFADNYTYNQDSGIVIFEHITWEEYVGRMHHLCGIERVNVAYANDIHVISGSECEKDCHIGFGYQSHSDNPASKICVVQNCSSKMTRTEAEAASAGYVDVIGDGSELFFFNIKLPWGRIDAGYCKPHNVYVFDVNVMKIEVARVQYFRACNWYAKAQIGSALDMATDGAGADYECDYELINTHFDLTDADSGTSAIRLDPTTYNIRSLKLENFTFEKTKKGSNTISNFIWITSGSPLWSKFRIDLVNVNIYDPECEYPHHWLRMFSGTRPANVVVKIKDSYVEFAHWSLASILGQWGIEPDDDLRHTTFIQKETDTEITGKITTPFDYTTDVISQDDDADQSNPEASTDYVAEGFDMVITSTGGTGVSITIKDPNGNTVVSGLTTLNGYYLPRKYKINFGGFSVTPTVTACIIT